MPVTKRAVEYEPDDEPDDQPFPGAPRKGNHQVERRSAPAGAVNQIMGALKGRGSPGSRTRSTRMPIETITKARRVPIETRLPASRTVNQPAGIATARPVTIEVIQGV